MELRDVALSGVGGRFNESVCVEAKTEGPPQNFDKVVKEELHAQSEPEHHHLGETGNVIGKSFQQLSAHGGTSSPDDGVFGPRDYSNTPGTGRRTISLSMALLRHCAPSCQCQCHFKHITYTPTWLRPVLGQISLQYNSSLLMSRPPCNRPSCTSRESNSIYFQFFLPRWLLSRAILASLTWDCGLSGPGASLHLSVPRVFEFDCGINAGLVTGNITWIQQKMATGALRPTDVDSLSGETVFTVR